jgi:hypothetical protein
MDVANFTITCIYEVGSMALDPTQVAALQLALEHEEPGIVFINETKRLPEIDRQVARLEEFFPVSAVIFVAANAISEPGLQVAISRTDFTQSRLIAEDDTCYAFALSELKEHLESAQNALKMPKK